jgi:hypothetical protein
MLKPSQPVTLTVEQIAELNGKLSFMRHEINNRLAVIGAAMELIRMKPDTADRMLATLAEQPPRIADALKMFSADFEGVLGITRP